MIDSLEMLRDKVQAQATCKDLSLEPQQYGLVTLHRPSNVDSPKKLRQLFDHLSSISKKIPLVFPIHPRTRKNADRKGILAEAARQECHIPLWDGKTADRVVQSIQNHFLRQD